MKKTLIHLSDLHYQEGKPESYGVVLSELLKDLDAQLEKDKSSVPYLVFSGDIVKEGDKASSYDNFLQEIAPRFLALGIDRNRIICVPGNHDVAREQVDKNLMVHEGIVSQIANEDLFHQHIHNQELFRGKFSAFLAFSNEFSAFNVGSTAMGSGWDLGGEFGIYCLNSAVFSGAGLSSINGSPIKDKGRLAVDTRGLHDWIQNSKFNTRAVVMHHPPEWLCEWSRRELVAVLGKNVDLLLTGHTHEQDSYSRSNSLGQFAHCLAPALYSQKSDPLGYSLISIDSDGMLDSVHYRQWTKTQVFVAGTLFSNNDSGTVDLRKSRGVQVGVHPDSTNHVLGRPSSGSVSTAKIALAETLQRRLNDSLKSFSTQPIVFVDPVISDYSEATSEKLDSPKPTYDALSLLNRNDNVVVNAPVEFGLTCLARFLAATAWGQQHKVWLYLDAAHTKPHRQAIGEAVIAELAELAVEMSAVEGIIVDSIRSSDKDGPKLVKKISEYYPGLRLLCMRTNDMSGKSDAISDATGLPFKHAFLWSMTRSAIRKAVADYIDAMPIGDEDVITAKIASDFEVMNIHRTPLNCITLLKVSEFQYEDSPINRTEMINRVLHLLFNVDHIPAYKSRPDLKDCEFVLGYFCEQILRTEEYQFLREKFVSSIEAFCKKNFLDLDINVVFDVLFANNIIVSRGGFFEFRFSYWILYFAAQRMYHSKDFATYVFEGMRYANYPEIIEFYTGINRAMEDAVAVLSSDLRHASQNFEEKLALPEDFDMFSIAQWVPSPDGLEQMKADMSRGIQTSNLPESVKDQYADRDYDRSRPYNQDVKNIFSGRSYSQMLQTMRAGAKALRNSDYVATELKRALLEDILSVWERAATAILVLVPALAKDGTAEFDDVRYVLDGTFGDEIEDRFLGVLQVIPQNIASYYQEDLFSHKMGPLLNDALVSATSNVRRHLIALVLIKNRPKNWAHAVKGYIATLPKNSFYLADVYQYLRTQYQYGYASEHVLEEIEMLILTCASKHFTGAKQPGSKMIGRLKGRLVMGGGDPVPERMIGPDGALLVSKENDEVAQND